MKTTLFAVSAALFPFTVFAHDGMAVEDAYARGGHPKAGAVFMLLENHREVDCTLTGVTSDVAEHVMLHTSVEKDGVMKMQPIEGGIMIPAGGVHPLTRGGDHVMLMGLKTPLEDGASVALTLDFGDCGTENVEVPVDNKRADAGHGDDHKHGHKHEHGNKHDHEHDKGPDDHKKDEHKKDENKKDN